MQTFSHRGSDFAPPQAVRGGRMQQRTRELQPEQIVALGGGSAKRLGDERPGSARQGRQSCHGGAGDLQAELGSSRQYPAHGDQHTTGAHVQGRGKLKELLPLPSRLRTKTGIASGNLAHLRRSLPGRTPFMQNSPKAHWPGQFSILVANSWAKDRGNRDNGPYLPPVPTAKPVRDRASAGLIFVFYSSSHNRHESGKALQKCKLLLHLGNSVAFSVDNELRRGLRFSYLPPL